MVYVLGAVVIIFGLVIIWYASRRIISWRKRLRGEVREAQEALHNAFDALHEDVSEQMDNLKDTRGKRQKSMEEEQIREHLKESLDIAEKFVQKEIEDVEKETE